MNLNFDLPSWIISRHSGMERTERTLSLGGQITTQEHHTRNHPQRKAEDILPHPLERKAAFIVCRLFMMVILTSMRWHLIVVFTCISGVEKRKPSYTVGGNVQPLWRTVWQFLKNIKNRATMCACMVWLFATHIIQQSHSSAYIQRKL